MNEVLTVLFAFGNQKGGVGKTTLSTIFGNYLHQVHGKDFKFAGVDGDYQKSYFTLRVRDLDVKKDGIEDSDLHKLVFKTEKELDLYHIYQVSSEGFKDEFIDKFNGNFDYMVIDLPGNLKQKGVMDSYMPVEVLFTPLNPMSDNDIESTITFLDRYKEVDKMRQEAGLEPCEKYIISSKRDRRFAFNKEEFRKKFENFDVKFLEEEFPYSPVSFGQNVNTLLEYKKNLKDKETEQLCIKLFEILENKYNTINS